MLKSTELLPMLSVLNCSLMRFHYS